VSASEDEDPVEAVAADGTDPALGERVGVRRSYGRADHLDPLAAKDLVEGAAELGVAIVDQQLELLRLLAQLHDEVARLLRDPRPVRIRAARDEREPAGCH
jgi:hypothetical protein